MNYPIATTTILVASAVAFILAACVFTDTVQISSKKEKLFLGYACLQGSLTGFIIGLWSFNF